VKKFSALSDEVSPTYHGTGREVPVISLPAYPEAHPHGLDFPRYLTDDVRELSYLENPEMLTKLAEDVIANFTKVSDWQQAFDNALTEVEDLPEIRRRIFQLLPTEVQQMVVW
jgi:hypothetical protein